MKKTMLLLGALMLSAAAGYAQESRQDVSVGVHRQDDGAVAERFHDNPHWDALRQHQARGAVA